MPADLRDIARAPGAALKPLGRDDGSRQPAPGRRKPRRRGRAASDSERRALAKAHATPPRPPPPPRPGFAVLHADGGARDRAAIGYLLEDASGTRLAEHAEIVGGVSAAEAEFRALLAGLRRAQSIGLTKLVARSDSRLLIDHVRGERRIRSPGLVALGDEITELSTRIGSVMFEWIPASANGEAHRLVADVLESAT